MDKKIRQVEFWVATVLLVTYVVIYVHHAYLLKQESMSGMLPFNLAAYLLPNLLTGLVIYSAFGCINFWLVPRCWITYAYLKAITGTITCMVCTVAALTAIAFYLPYQPVHSPAAGSTLKLISRTLSVTVPGFAILAIYIVLRRITMYQYRQYGLSRTLASKVIKEVGTATLAWLWIFTLLWGLEYKPLFGRLGLYYLIVLPFGMMIYFVNLYWLLPVLKNSPANNSWRYAIRLITILILLTPLETVFIQAASLPLSADSLLLTAWLMPLTIALILSCLVYKINEQYYGRFTSLTSALNVADARLQLLRSQINPHFLFNTLNALYGTAITDGSMRTAEGIQQLSDIMRFMLHENSRDLIPLGTEVGYLKNYLSLQKLRLGEVAVKITSDLDRQGWDLLIAPMLLIPLVENAFKHGIGPPDSSSFISLSLRVDGKRICFRVSNCIAICTHRNPEKDYSGIGLSNVSQRLQVYHKGRHQFIYGAVNGIFTAELVIDTPPIPEMQTTAIH